MAEMSNWYGSIPDTWKVVSFNQSVRRMATGLNPRENFALSKTDEFYYVTIRNFKDNQLFLDDNCDRISREAWEIIQARSDLHKGDILFASISKDGQAYLLNADPINWNINESVFCIRVDEKLFNNRYFRYEITNIGFYSDLLLDATGTTFKSIKQNKLRQSKLISPPLSEQHAIADYLDARCSKIDEIIAEATASIEEYKELKQAVIFEAVTKGLDKNALMKDSGIKGWGQIPYTWKCIRMKNLIMSISSGLSAITSDNNSDESGLYVLRTSAVSTGEFKPDEVKSVLKNDILKMDIVGYNFISTHFIDDKITPIIKVITNDWYSENDSMLLILLAAYSCGDVLPHVCPADDTILLFVCIQHCFSVYFYCNICDSRSSLLCCQRTRRRSGN